MKLWKLSQKHVRENGSNYYRVVFVAAETEEEARNADVPCVVTGFWPFMEHHAMWDDTRRVNVEYLGEATDGTEAGYLDSQIIEC
jgi:hypothetical protein